MALTVVKIGGSLDRDPLLRDWLQMLLDAGRGQVVVVAGGGAFADLVRQHQAHWQFDDLAAHNMAVLAMMQSTTMMKALAPGLVLAATPAAAARALRGQHVVLWWPRRWLRRLRALLRASSQVPEGDDASVRSSLRSRDDSVFDTRSIE